MIKAVLDTNVFVSAILKPQSNPGCVIDLIREHHIKLFISPAILAEIKATLQYPKLKKLHRLSSNQVDTLLKRLAAAAEITPGKIVIEAVKDDPSDNIYLGCAVEGNVDYIVSGDRHLTSLETFRGIRIVNPATLLKFIKKGNN